MAGNKRIVGPSSTGKGWQSVDPGGKTTRHRTQGNAEKQAGKDLKGSGGGERITQGRDGKIRAKDTIAPAKDPREIKVECAIRSLQSERLTPGSRSSSSGRGRSNLTVVAPPDHIQKLSACSFGRVGSRGC